MNQYVKKEARNDVFFVIGTFFLGIVFIWISWQAFSLSPGISLVALIATVICFYPTGRVLVFLNGEIWWERFSRKPYKVSREWKAPEKKSIPRLTILSFNGEKISLPEPEFPPWYWFR
jgi:apolipoprotein N-acyltransferase